MADILERLGSNIKSTFGNIKGLPFSSLGGTYGSSGYMGGSLPGWGFSFQGTLPGSQFDDSSAAGVLWENPAAAACFVAYTKAFAQAKPYLEKKGKGNDWERFDHEIIELIERPNDFYSGEKMFGVTLICAMSQGAAFWRLERDKRGIPVDIWYEPPVGIGMTGIAPNWDSQNFIKDYYRFVDGQREKQPIDTKDIVYFRHGLNVANPRMPWSPLGLGAREIAVLNGGSTYTSAILRNQGSPAGFISMGDAGVEGTGATPQQAKELKQHIEANFGGPQNAGKTFVSPLPWRWNKVGMSPDELAIDKVLKMPLTMVCALLGVPVDVALLNWDSPTYENLNSSMKWWWDNSIIPLEDSFADELETQLFPSFGLDSNEFRIVWDRSKVPALQDDEVAKHTMWRSDYQAGLIDRATFLERIGEVAKPEDEGVYFGAPQNEQDQNAQNLIKTGGQPAAKSEDAAKSFTLKLTEDDMPNDDQLEAKNEDEIIEANTDGEFTAKDIEDALQSRTPAMQALLTARPDKE